MEKSQLKKILIDQKEEIQTTFKAKQLIERSIYSFYKQYLKSNLIKVITGIRRSGKSVLSYQLVKDQRFVYVNFDDERLVSIEAVHLNDILEVIYEVYGKFKFIVLDEIQNIDGWELFVNRLQRQGFNIIVTGSNAKLLSKEFSTHLTGRHIVLELFPFSFKEYLIFYERSINLKKFSTKEIGLLKKDLDDYIEKGGFPEVLNENISQNVYLQSLYSSILNKDVMLRHKIRFVKTLKDISNYLLSNCSSQLSFNKIKNIFNIKSIHTAVNYVSFLEESYLFFFLRRMSYKHKESLIASRKVYAVDIGLVNSLSTRFSKDYGKLYENIVCVELMRRRSQDSIDIYYWQDIYKHEVDFVIKKGLKITQLIQVSYDIQDYDTMKRETKALISASKNLRCNNLLIITKDMDAEKTIDKKKIKFIPLWKWLLT